MSADLTAEKALETLNKLQADIVANKSAIAASDEQRAKAVADLSATVRALQEAQARDAMPRPHATEIGLREYAANDGLDLTQRVSISEEARSEGRKAGPAFVGGGDTTLRLRGVVDPDTREYLPGLLDDPETHGEWHGQLKRLVDDYHLRESLAPGKAARLAGRIQRHMAAGPDVVRRVFSTGAGVGAEWLDTPILPMLEQDLRAARRIEALFGSISISTKAFEWPFLTDTLTPVPITAPTNNDPSNFTASNVSTTATTFTPKSWAVRTVLFDEAVEDSAVEVLPELRRGIVSAVTDGVEDAIINADTAATDAKASWNPRSRWTASLLHATEDHRGGWVGLRQRAVDVSNTTDMSAAQTYAGIIARRASLDSPYGLNDCVMITSPEWYLAKLLGVTEVATVEKYGAAATVLTGEVARIGGLPVVISEFMTADLNASGVFDNVTLDYTGMLVVNRSRFFVIRRKGASVEAVRKAENGTIHLISRSRQTFGTPDSATKKNVSYAYKLSKS